MNTRLRNRILGVAAACAMGLSLSGCVAYDDGAYGPGYGGGGYYGGGYGGTSVNVYAPVRYRGHHNNDHQGGYRGHGGGNGVGGHDGGGQGGSSHGDGGRHRGEWRHAPNN